MDPRGFYTPPNPGKYAAPPNAAQDLLGHLIKLHEMGVISKEELRQKVIAWKPGPTPTPQHPVSQDRIPRLTPADKQIEEPDAETRNQKKRRASKDIDVGPPVRKKGKKERTGKPSVGVAELRKIVKDPTRRRFFAQCLKPDSILWHKTPAGTEYIQKFLFNKAAQAPMNIIYSENPGATRSVKSTQMMKIIKWQVTKDRSNWNGKTPKRKILFGTPLEFDWEGELQKLSNARAAERSIKAHVAEKPSPSLVLEKPSQSHVTEKPSQSHVAEKPSQSHVAEKPSQSHVAENPSQSHVAGKPGNTPSHQTFPPRANQPIPPVSEPWQQTSTVDVDSCTTCLSCGMCVWIGDPEQVPHDIPIAYPRGSDWSNPNINPYCKSCWDAEMEILDGLTSQHRAIGSKNKKAQTNKNKNAQTNKKNKAQTNKKTKTQTNKKKNTRTNKKKKGRTNKKNKAKTNNKKKA